MRELNKKVDPCEKTLDKDYLAVYIDAESKHFVFMIDGELSTHW